MHLRLDHPSDGVIHIKSEPVELEVFGPGAICSPDAVPRVKVILGLWVALELNLRSLKARKRCERRIRR